MNWYRYIELKAIVFEHEHDGKPEFYSNAADEQMKLPEDSTRGLLFCKIADKGIAECDARLI